MPSGPNGELFNFEASIALMSFSLNHELLNWVWLLGICRNKNQLIFEMLKSGAFEYVDW
jgi:hypothetical protein